MKKLNYYMIASAVGLALSAPSMAAELTDAEYATAEQKIEAEHASATTACASLSGNENEICIVEADSKNEVAKAELEAKNDPTAEISQANSTTNDSSGYNDTLASDSSGDSDTGATVTPTDRDTAESDTSMYGDSRASDTSGDNDSSENDTSGYGDTRASESSSDSDSSAADTLFDFDSADLRAEGRETLDEFVEKSKENSVAQISVTGYTDRLGDGAYNQHLSEMRTKAVKDYLVGEGVAANRIRAEGKGDAQSTLSANECQGEQGAAVIACLQPDRRVVVSMSQVVGSN